MDLDNVVKAFMRHLKIIIILPVAVGLIVYFLTGNMKSEYSVKATIFTGITAPSSLNDIGGERVDFYANRTAFNNLISILSSRMVIEETSLRLLARHLVLDSASPIEISEKSLSELQKIIPDDLKNLIDKQDEEMTYQNLRNYLQEDKQNFIYGLLNYNHPYYSYKALSSIRAVQAGTSDLIEITYKSSDPGIAYQTLTILIEVFIKNYGEVKRSQTDAVVTYFQNQLAQSASMLQSVEDSLLLFNKRNNIINYYEQTKYISSQQEKIDVRLQEVLLEYNAASAVLEKIEEEIKSRASINLNTKAIMEIRQDLVEINNKIADQEIREIELGLNINSTDSLYTEKERFEDQLKSRLDSLTRYQYGSEGLGVESLLIKWLNTVSEFESASAKLRTMREKNEEYSKMYSHYAPLGAYLKKIEREIGVREQAYLQILHNLGLAKLKQQSEEMRADMKVIDDPQLPINPEPTKRKLYTIILSLFTLIFAVAGVFLFELLDRTVKSITRLGSFTGLKVSAGLAKGNGTNDLNDREMVRMGLKTAVQDIIKARKYDIDPVVIQAFSIRQGEGKSFFADALSEYLISLGYKVRNIEIVQGAGMSHEKVENKEILTSGEGLRFSTYQELLQEYNLAEKNFDFFVVELPSIDGNIINSTLAASATMSYLVVDSGRVWTSSDAYSLGELSQTVSGNIEAVLNRACPQNLEPMVVAKMTENRIQSLINQLIRRKRI